MADRQWQTVRNSLISTLLAAALIFLVLLGACQSAPAPSQPPATPAVPAPLPTPAPPPITPPKPPVTPQTTPAPLAPVPSHPPMSIPAIPKPAETTVISEEFGQTLACHFGFMPAMFDFGAAREAGAAYDRPFFELFQWGMIEKEPGLFDFSYTDEYVRRAQADGFHILANIQPFAHWDQAKCHQDLPVPEQPGDPRFHSTKGKPCDMEAYKNFVGRLVERYDGDGVDDMPGLTFPIRHWEVLNEPEFNEEPLIFFQGSPDDYFEILKATYEAVKGADAEAMVVQGGMAGMMDVSTNFWQNVFDLGGADYFDIANMHSIGHGEHLNIPAFKQFLAKNGVDKPMWVTEVQFQQAHQTENYSNEDFAKILARSYVFALTNGVEKLFYVNIKMPPVRQGVPFDERSALIKDNGDKSPLFYAHLTVAEMLGDLGSSDEVEILKEKVGDWHIEEGQYKFTIGGKVVYALWGGDSLPAEISGNVEITEISGASRVTDAATLKLSDSPIFIEMD